MFDNVQFTGKIDLGSICVAILSLVGIYRAYIAIKIDNLKHSVHQSNRAEVCEALLKSANEEISNLKERLQAIETPKV